jgi:hypothetical protein
MRLDPRSRPSKENFPNHSDLGCITCECWGPVGPQPIFGEPWSCLTIFWDFDSLVKDRAPRRRGYSGISPPFMGLLGFRVYVMGMGCHPMSLPILRPLF